MCTATGRFASAAASHFAAVTRDDAFVLFAFAVLGAVFRSFMATILRGSSPPRDPALLRVRSAGMGEAWRLLRYTASDWYQDRAQRISAALAYYTIFALTPGIVILMALR